VILISSLTTLSGYFVPKLKSLRLIVVVADSPVTVSPSMPFCGGAGFSASKTTDLVTPAMVRSPKTSYPLLDFLTDVDLKVIRRYFETLKKSAPRSKPDFIASFGMAVSATDGSRGCGEVCTRLSMFPLN
jgi:hypothetical protein